MPRKPDILLIILDTLRRDHLSAYGHPGDTSPAFDAFAEEATLFRRAIAPAQWTIPAHGSMFTGLYPTQHGLTQAAGGLSGMHPTLAEILAVGGYSTVAFCNNPLVGVLDNGLQRGFDAFYNYSGVAVNRPVDTHQPLLRRQMSARFQRAARSISNRFAHDEGLFRLTMNRLLTPVWTRFINYKGNTAHSIDDFITADRAYHASGPQAARFTFINLMGAHLPYHPPQELVTRIAPELRGDRRAHAFMRAFNGDAALWPSPPDPAFSDWQQRTLDAYYTAEVMQQDRELERLFAYLQRSGRLDDTLVIVAADHGEGLGDHDFFGHGFVVYQELVHVPLLIRGPGGFAAGARIDDNISTRRIFHTILDVAGLQPPLGEDDPNAAIDTLSLATPLPGASEANTAYAEAYPALNFLHLLEHRNPALIDRLRLRDVRRGVYRDDHKLALVGEDVEGIFNVAEDPFETDDITARSNGLAADLRGTLEAFRHATGPQVPAPGGQTSISPEVERSLRELGYID
jgi:arylsulfatase A-like enzyme